MNKGDETMEPKVGDWVCYLDGSGTALSVIEYIVDKGVSGIPSGQTERQYIAHMHVLERGDILEVRSASHE